MDNTSIDASYWENRAHDEYCYKGELFYTITPIPYYCARRKIILELLAKEAKDLGAQDIFDYGCGTGEYMSKLYSEYGVLSIRGGDCSIQMLEQARKTCQKVGLHTDFVQCDSGVNGHGLFDMIYVVAVFAHLEDKAIQRILQSFFEHLRPEGVLVICEQTGSFHIEGKTYRRRTVSEYEELLKEEGFVIKSQSLIDFWAHRILFEHKLAHWIYRHCFHGTDHERRISANRTYWFRLLSSFFTKISWPRLFQARDGWGYTFMKMVRP